MEPSIYLSIKHLIEKANIRQSIFSLSSSFNKIIGSYQEISKPSQNEISNFIEEQDEVSSPEEDNLNQEELLARMEQEVQEMGSSHNVNRTDAS
jgi:hypothetical protein